INVLQEFITYFLYFQISSKIEFTNIKCTSMDKDFCDFEYCYIKSINRTYKYISLKVKLYKVPITNVTISSKSEFTNINCTSMDKEFCDFDYCYIKSINRTYKYISLKVKLYKVPITNVTINWSILKRSNGYKPFLYNITADGCKFLKNQKSNPVLGYMYGLFKSHSNMNHTCPFDVSFKMYNNLFIVVNILIILKHDLIVDELSTTFLNYQFTKLLPFPEGEYLFKTNWIAYGILRATVDVFLRLT
ncbi:hypothetical protein KR067_010190, partial [Drosophila pandora]